MTRFGQYTIGAMLVFAFIQLIPYGKQHSNPAVAKEPRWTSAETRGIAQRACFDCHSNQTQWPWYANVAPASWLVQWDVTQGRRHLNFSNWDQPGSDFDEAAQQVRQSEMPPWYYRSLHPEARLQNGERQRLIAGLETVVRAAR